MCGIAGVIGTPGQEAVRRMITETHYRGPDDNGVYSDEKAALGANRLAILDLSPAGHQPMCSQDGRYWIVYNGETYNFREERARLESKGWAFRSHSDTEVVLCLFLEYGVRCVEHMRGMFAFAIWDTKDQKLFAARDHLGIKPFYFYHKENVFVFGSEIKSLLASGIVPREIDLQGLQHFLILGTVQPPNTIIKGVQPLLPGHLLLFQDGQVTVESYWDIYAKGFAPKLSAGSFDDLKEQLREKLLEAVRLQLISDVPLGVFLSGGLDSAAVVAMMAHAGASRIRTFSVGFDDAGNGMDETRYAEETANFFGTEHKSHIISSEEVEREFDNFIRAVDQPSKDALNTYFISQFTRPDVTVALSGLGGDELFAGYSRTWWVYQKQVQSNALQHLLVRGCQSSLGELGLHMLPDNVRTKLKFYCNLFEPLKGYAQTRQVFDTPQLERLLRPDILREMSLQNVDTQVQDHGASYLALFDDPALTDLIQRLTRLELKSFMPFQLLRDMDAVSMFHSLEVRFPLIDHEVVEFAFTVPSQFKYSPQKKTKFSGESFMTYEESGAKRIFRAAVRRDLPPDFGERRKSGFKLPIAQWLRTSFAERLQDTFNDSGQSSLFCTRGLQQLLVDFKSGKASWVQVWSVLVVSSWYRQHLT